MATQHVKAATRKMLLSKIAASGLNSVIEDLHQSDRAEAFLCAGAVRDAFLSVLANTHLHPKDFDVGLGGLTKREFQQISSRLGAKPNRYGGIRIALKSGISADLWRLEDTVGIRLNNSSPDIEHVLRSFVLDVNAVAFNLRTQRFVDCGAVSSLKHRTIDLVPDALLHDRATFAARAILLALRFSFQLSRRLQNFTLSHFDAKVFRYELGKLPRAWSGPGGSTHRKDLISASAPELLTMICQSSRSAQGTTSAAAAGLD
jgi:hypothetical protein